MANLPGEVITHIMRFLSVSDRKEASLVNKTWYEASLDPIIQRDMVVTFCSTQDCEHPICNFGRRRSTNLVFEQLDGSSKSKELLLKSCQHLSPNLHMVSFKGSDITESIFYSFIIHCNSLEKLDLSCCNALFMSGNILEKERDRNKLKSVLKNVKELNLSSIRYISDATFNRIIEVLPNLRKLAIASSPMLFQSTSYLRGRDMTKTSGDMNVFTFDNLLSFLWNRCENIESLNFSRTSLNDRTLQALCEVPGLKLKELFIVNCKELTDGGLCKALKKQPHLEYLDCSGCSEVGNGTLLVMKAHLPSIKRVVMRQCQCITDTAVAELHHMPSLRQFDLSPGHNVTTKGLTLGLCKPSLNNLAHLSLNGCNAVTDTFVFSMCDVLTNLEKLDLSSCFSITDVSVHAISKNLKHLVHLDLGWCKNITDLGLLGLVNDRQTHHEHDGLCKCMRNLDAKDVYKFHDPTKIEKQPTLLDKDEIRNLQEKLKKDNVYTLANLSQLQYLSLQALPHITDISLTQVLNLKELRSLNLTMCPKLTDATLFTISRNLPSLEKLFLGKCAKITDDGLYLVLKSLPRLMSLDLTTCDQLTDKTVVRIGEKCKRLRHLDVSFCSLITEESMEVLEKKLQHLTDVKKRFIKVSNY